MRAGELVYLDTSGILAFLNRDDGCHGEGSEAFRFALGHDLQMVMTDYVRLEAWSLIQRRLGFVAVMDFKAHILPNCRIEPVGEMGFELLARQAILGRRKGLSLVDLSSFDCMTRLNIEYAIGFDRHFEEMGYFLPQKSE